MNRIKRLRKTMEIENYKRFWKWNFWGIVLLWLCVFMLLIANLCKGQDSYALVRTYVDGELINKVENVWYADYYLDESGQELMFILWSENTRDTITYQVKQEKDLILEDNMLRSIYILNNKSKLVTEPQYEDGEYIGDYCKIVMRDVGVFDKILIIFFAKA